MNDGQGNLFAPRRNGSIQAQFEAFHANNPQIYEMLKIIAYEWREAGHKKCGIRMLWEVMRWRIGVQTNRPPRDYKLNDHYHSRYVRKLIEENPDLKNFFELRELQSP